MGVDVLYGESIHTLADACFDGISRHLRDPLQSNAILIVPETAKMDIEQAYLGSAGGSGMMRLEILSFSRFCHRILGEIGRASAEYIDETGKSMLVYKALRDNEERLLLFRNICSNPRFVSGVIAVMGEMNRVLVSHGMLSEKAAAIPDPVSAQKARELAVVMESYENELKEAGLRDPQEQYTIAAEHLAAAAGMLRDDKLRWPYDRLAGILKSDVWILGFGEIRDFTPQEYAILDVLAGSARLHITIVRNRGTSGGYLPDGGEAVFKAGFQCFDGIRGRWPSGDNIYIPPIRPGLFTHIGNCWQTHRELRLEDPVLQSAGPLDPVPAAAAKGRISMIYAPGPREEISLVAGEIRRLIQTGGMRYRDIIVMASEEDFYRPVVRSIFEEAGIPLYIDEKKLLLDTALGRAVTAVLNIINSGWNQTHVMAYLRSGFCNADRSEIDDFESFMLSKGIKYRSRIFDDRNYAVQDEVRQDLIGLRNRVFSNIDAFGRSVVNCRTAGDYCDAFMAFIRDERIEEKTALMSEGLIGQNQTDPATAAVKAWNVLTGLLGQTRKIAAGTRIDFSAFRGIVISGMEKAVSGTIPYSVDCVRFSPIRQITGMTPEALFVAGLSADRYPGRATDEGLLNDRDREMLSGCLDIRIPSIASDKVYEDMYLSYTFLTSSADRLYLSTPASAEGESRVMTLAKNSTGEHAVIEYQQDPPPEAQQIYDTGTALFALSRIPPVCVQPGTEADNIEAGKDDGWTILENIFNESPALSRKLGDMRSIHRRASAEIAVSGDKISSCYRRQPEMSISQLEKYAACSFSHYSQYLLKLQVRDRREIQTAEFGSVLHGIVELAVRKFTEEYNNAVDDAARRAVIIRYSQEDYDETALRLMKETAVRDHLGMFLDTGNFASRGRPSAKLAAAMLKQIFKNYVTDSLLPEKVEWEFSSQNGNALEILPDADFPVMFRGKVDRIDGDGNLFRIVDYKSGAKKVDFDLWYSGLSLQLPAYVAAYMQNYPGRIPADAGYLQFVRPIIDMRNKDISDIEQTVEAEISKKTRLSGTGMTSGQMAAAAGYTISKMRSLSSGLLHGRYGVNPKKIEKGTLPCEYCDYPGFCGIEKNTDNITTLRRFAAGIGENGKKLNRRDAYIRLIEEERGKKWN
ncbi:MAG: PD-(D/E)XK nuclease family protein [Saccharofermentanales bacterium]